MLSIANIIEEGRYGGPQARILAVADKLNKIGIETTVILPKIDSSFFRKQLSEHNINAIELNLHRLTRQQSQFLKYIIFFVPELLVIYKTLKNGRVQVVHCNGAWQVKGIIAGKLSGAKVIWHINDSSMPPIVKFLFKFLAVYFSDAFILSGHNIAPYYLSENASAKKLIKVIHPPVNTFVFDPSKVTEDHKISSHDGTKIVTIANLNPIKGLEYFIEMATILNHQYQNLNFFIIGAQHKSQKKYTNQLCSLVKKLQLHNLYFYGQSDNVPSILKSADMFVCTSISEAGPMSVWEAMSMEKAIVSTDVGDVNRFIENGKNGFIVPVKDPRALADKLALLIDNPDLRKSFGQSARAVAVKSLDIDICAKKHAEFYKEVMDNS